jgi:hypothetical protein
MAGDANGAHGSLGDPMMAHITNHAYPVITQMSDVMQSSPYEFSVNDQKYHSTKPEIHGVEIKALASVSYPQQLYIEEEGSAGDRCISDRDVVDLAEKPRRFYLVPSAIVGG